MGERGGGGGFEREVGKEGGRGEWEMQGVVRRMGAVALVEVNDGGKC